MINYYIVVVVVTHGRLEVYLQVVVSTTGSVSKSVSIQIQKTDLDTGPVVRILLVNKLLPAAHVVTIVVVVVLLNNLISIIIKLMYINKIHNNN